MSFTHRDVPTANKAGRTSLPRPKFRCWACIDSADKGWRKFNVTVWQVNPMTFSPLPLSPMEVLPNECKKEISLFTIIFNVNFQRRPSVSLL